MHMQTFAAMLVNVSPDIPPEQCLDLKNEHSALLTLPEQSQHLVETLLCTRGQQDSQQLAFLLL